MLYFFVYTISKLQRIIFKKKIFLLTIKQMFDIICKRMWCYENINSEKTRDKYKPNKR